MSTVDRRRAVYVSVLEREAAEKRALWAAGASSDAALAAQRAKAAAAATAAEKHQEQLRHARLVAADERAAAKAAEAEAEAVRIGAARRDRPDGAEASAEVVRRRSGVGAPAIRPASGSRDDARRRAEAQRARVEARQRVVEEKTGAELAAADARLAELDRAKAKWLKNHAAERDARVAKARERAEAAKAARVAARADGVRVKLEAGEVRVAEVRRQRDGEVAERAAKGAERRARAEEVQRAHAAAQAAAQVALEQKVARDDDALEERLGERRASLATGQPLAFFAAAAADGADGGAPGGGRRASLGSVGSGELPPAARRESGALNEAGDLKGRDGEIDGPGTPRVLAASPRTARAAPVSSAPLSSVTAATSMTSSASPRHVWYESAEARAEALEEKRRERDGRHHEWRAARDARAAEKVAAAKVEGDARAAFVSLRAQLSLAKDEKQIAEVMAAAAQTLSADGAPPAASPRRRPQSARATVGDGGGTAAPPSPRSFSKLARCALCEMQVERDQLDHAVSYNAIYRQREAWGATMPARALSARYDAAKVCGFCFQFFDTKAPTAKDVSRSERSRYKRPASARASVGPGTTITDPTVGGLLYKVK